LVPNWGISDYYLGGQVKRKVWGLVFVVITALLLIACGGGKQADIGTVDGACKHNGDVRIDTNGKWECQWKDVGKPTQELRWVLSSR
jgi:hypothetical protein